MANLEKARGFRQERNYIQQLRFADLAASKLKQMKERRPVELIDEALKNKYGALLFLAHHKEALECAKEWYCLWPTKHTHPPAIEASFAVIESCMFNNEFFDAALYARTLWETITMSRDSHIPEKDRERYTARGALELSRALWQLAQSGGMPAEEQQVAGVESIMLARRALEINTRLRTESEDVAAGMSVLASILDFFNDVDDGEVPRLYEQAIAIYARVHGSVSSNVAVCENNLSAAYQKLAKRAQTANDMDRCVANLELALPHLREAARIFRAVNHMENADLAAQAVVEVEEFLRQVAIIKA